MRKKLFVKLLSCAAAVSLVGVPMLISRAVPSLKGINVSYMPGGVEKYVVSTGTTISESDLTVIPNYRDGITRNPLAPSEFELSVPDGTVIADGENHFTVTYQGKTADIYITGISGNTVGTRIIAGIPAYTMDITVQYKTADTGIVVSTDTSRAGDNALTVRKGNTVTVNADVPDGYELYTGQSPTWTSDPVNNDKTEVVTFIVQEPVITHTITVVTIYLDSDGNVDHTDTSTVPVNDGDTVTVSAPTETGYTVRGEASYTLTPTSDMSVEFVLMADPVTPPTPPTPPTPTPPTPVDPNPPVPVKAKYTVTYTDGGIGAFTSEAYIVEEGSPTPAFTGSTDRDGFIFKGWSPSVSDTVTSDATYTAVYEIDNQQYTITVIILLTDEDGNIIGQTAEDYTYKKGENVLISAPDVDGYDIIGQNSKELTVTQDETVTFTYKKQSAPVPPEPIPPEPVDPVEPEPVDPVPVNPDPLRPDPVNPELVQPSPVNPTPTEPAQPEVPSEQPEAPKDIPDDKEPDNKPDNKPDNRPDNKPDTPEKPDDIPVPQDIPDETQKDTPDKTVIPDEIPDDTPKDIPEDTPSDIPSDEPEQPQNPFDDPIVRRNVTTALIGGAAAVTLVATGTLSHFWLLILLLFFKKRRIKFHSILSDEENKYIETEVPAGSDPRLLQSIVDEFKIPERIYEVATATGCVTYLPPNTKMYITALGEKTKYKADENKLYSLLCEYKGEVLVNFYQKAAKIDITIKFTLHE